MNRVVFHIGAWKTGTTSIQDYFVSNGDMLEKAGWYYTDFKKILEDEGLIADDPCGGGQTGSIFFRTYYRSKVNGDGIFDRLLQALKSALDKGNVLVSDAMFWIMGTDLKDFFRAVSSVIDKRQIVVVAYLRRQDLFIESVYNQLIKFGKESRSFKVFAKEEIGFCRYWDIISAIMEVLPKENLRIRKFEKNAFTGSGGVVEDFFALLDTEGLTYDPQRKRADSNERISGNWLEFKRLYNTISEDGYDILNEDIYEEMKCGSIGRQVGRDLYGFDVLMKLCCDIDKKEVFFTNEERREFLSGFESDNRKLTEEFWDSPFSGIKETDADVHKELSDEARDIVTLVIRLYLTQTKRLRTQALRNGVTEEDSLRKPLAVWGAGTLCERILRENLVKPGIIVDSFPTVRKMYGIPVVGPDEIDLRKYYFVLTMSREAPVLQMLEDYGLVDGRDYSWWYEYL
ncbi:MAG: hypothetical protein K5886_08520 [Lachnospiraceae bacterium]|nr:hypothetical protein [Lachnospiraceae bacterium]